MRQFFRRLLFRRIRYKILALVMAVAIWYQVTDRSFDDRRISPVQPRLTTPRNIRVDRSALTEQPITLTLHSPEYVLNEYDLRPELFSVKIVLSPSMINEEALLREPNRTTTIRVSLDIGMVEERLPDEVAHLIHIQNIEPESLEIPVSLNVKTMPLRISVRGEPKEGFVAGDVILEPTRVEITGDEEALSRIEFIDLPPIDITGLSRTQKTNVEIDVERLQELYGPSVRILQSEDRTVTVTVPVEERREILRLSNIPVQPLNLPAGIEIESITPSSIVLTFEGSSAALDRIAQSVKQVEIDLSEKAPGLHEIGLSIPSLPEQAQLIEISSGKVRAQLKAVLEEPQENLQEEMEQE